MAGGFDEYLRELFEPLGGVSMRRMFGGLGVWRDGRMFALVHGDALHLKTDDETVPVFEAEGSEPFRYASKDGRVTALSYWRAPERLYDDPEAFLAFARLAVEAAARSEARKAKPRQKRAAKAN